MMLINRTEALQPIVDTLQKRFGLTAAETGLALEVARGVHPREAAKVLGIEMPMARSQMVSIFVKTETRHYGELMVLLSRLTAFS
jgi:DNA-binding CsgD family transcriptional regulator